MFFVRRPVVFLTRAWLSTTTAARTRQPSFAKPVLFLSGVSAAVAIYYYSPLSDRPDPLPLSPTHFTPTTLIESVDVSFNTKLLTLSVPPEFLPRDHGDFAPIWSVFVKDSDIQVERAYTPLEGIDDNGHMKFWIKKYEHGEVGRWLHSRQVDDSIEIRGPVQTWSRLWQDGHWDEVVLVSGGTGITPFYQLLHNVFNTRGTSFNARFTLLHGSKSLEDLPPPSMMQFLVALAHRHPDRFRLHLFADSTNSEVEHQSLNIRRGRIGRSVLQDVLRLTHNTPWWHSLLGLSHPTPSVPNKTLVLVCGPEGMVNAIAGPYGPNYSQDEVGGILGELGLQSHQVWKL